MGLGGRYNKSTYRKRKEFAGNLGNSIDNNQQQVQLPTSTSTKNLETSLETETSCGIAHGCNFTIDSDLYTLGHYDWKMSWMCGHSKYTAHHCTKNGAGTILCNFLYWMWLAYQFLFIKRGYQVK